MNAKNILLVYKKSAFSIYFEHPQSSFKKRGKLPQEIARFEETHRKHFECLRLVEHVLKRSGLSYHKICRGRPIDYTRFDLIITVGGDGTFLEAARSVKKQAILGVNSDPSWSVGRFCCADANTFEGILKKYLSRSASVKKFARIELQVRKHVIPVLNDILVCHHNPAAMSRYYLSIGTTKEEQKSSGIWIATAAGSSGGIKSAGGRQLPAVSDKIQYRPRELYRGNGGRSYKLKGGVLPSSAKITATSLIREGFVFVDGSHVSFPFDFGETIRVARSAHPLKVVWR
jgi:NAD+ kinase